MIPAARNNVPVIESHFLERDARKLSHIRDLQYHSFTNTLSLNIYYIFFSRLHNNTAYGFVKLRKTGVLRMDRMF
jgi:hypothetical protein